MSLPRNAITRDLNVCAIASLLLFLSWFVGCSDSHKETATSPSVPAQPMVENNGSPKTADAAVRRVLDGLRQQNARAVWEFLPPSHRAEVQQLIRDVAMELDAETWEATVAVWQKARKVLPAKSAAIFGQVASENSTESASRSAAKPAINSESLQRLFDSLGDSELADLPRLRQIDVGQFLQQTGNVALQVFGALPTGGTISTASFEKLAQVEVTLVSTSEENAVVRMKWPNQEPTEHTYVRIDGHWLPKTLVESWPKTIADIRTQAIAWAKGLKQQPAAWNAQLNAIDRLLDEIAATKSDDAARAVYQQGMQRLIAMWLGVPPPAPEQAPAPSPASSTSPAKKRKLPDTEELLPDEK